MPWLTPAPAPGQPITSNWGNKIENACQPVFATKAALDAGWSDAPDGAFAFVSADRKTYRRRNATWLLPLEAVQGVQLNRFAGPVGSSIPVIIAAPGWSLAAVGPFSLKGKRIYTVSVLARVVMLDSTPNQILGMHLNFVGTGADVPLIWHGGQAEFANGVEVVDAAYPFPFQNSVIKQSWIGSLATGGADDQVLSIRAQLVLNNTSSHFTVSETAISAVDIGPNP